MAFIKDNSYSIFILFVNQLAMMIFGLAISFATANYQTIFLIASIFAVIFYLVLLYTKTWDFGYESSQEILSGRKKFVKLGGVWMSLCANALNIILGILMIVGYFSAAEFVYRDAAGELTEDIALAVGKIPNGPEWAVNLFGIGKTILVFINSMYNGIMSSFMQYSPWIVFLFVTPSVIVCGIAYYLGVKGKHFTKLVGKEEKKE